MTTKDPLRALWVHLTREATQVWRKSLKAPYATCEIAPIRGWLSVEGFKTGLNERAAAEQAGSANWVPLDLLAAEITGRCPDGVPIVVAASGASADTLINIHGTMAGATLKKREAAGNKSISYLDFAGIEAAEEEAIAACGG